MLPKELIAKIRKIEIKTNRIVDSELAGGYHSTFKGQGIEFEEVRPYQWGDDVRTIDWNVSARMSTPYIKRFREERELFVWLLVDVSASTFFATRGKLKSEIAAELSALLAFSAIKNNDRIGVLFFSDTIEKFIPPKKGRKHVLRVITEILNFKPQPRRTNLSLALDYLGNVAKRRGVVFIISDFFDGEFGDKLHIAAKRHQIVPLVITDIRERELPSIGLISLFDAEREETITVDTSSAVVKRNFREKAETLRAKRKQIFHHAGLDGIEIENNRDWIMPVVNYFRRRAKKGWR
ncbi:MAG: DUF58 domain-containing protein [Myxococcota bacterium]